MASNARFVGIEGGGQSFLVTIAGPTWEDVIERKRFKTSHADPDSTLNAVADFVDQFPRVESIGFACFGPLDPLKRSPTYGHILETPKLAWANKDVLGHIKARFPTLPIMFDTDVNAAALSEVMFGGHSVDINPSRTEMTTEKGREPVGSAIYVTVGTGIGIGVVVDGQIIKGLGHPEGGHICVSRIESDAYTGNCPFHGDCLEGLANSQSIAERCGCTLPELIDIKDSNPVWGIIANYLAQMCRTLTCLLTPEVIVIGGGILNRGILYPMIREEFKKLMNGYLVNPRLTTDVGLEQYICASRFGSKAGAVGSVVLAKLALDAAREDQTRSRL